MAIRVERDKARTVAVRTQYIRLQRLTKAMRAGDEEARLEWMDLAKELIAEFRRQKVFYPWDKYIRFLGYGNAARKRAISRRPKDGVVNVEGAMEDMVDRLQSAALGTIKLTPLMPEIELRLINSQVEAAPDKADVGVDDPIPTEYREIEFADWLDIFCEYCLGLANSGRGEEAYEIIAAADDANVFYHEPEYIFRVHVCWTGTVSPLSLHHFHPLTMIYV